MQNLISQFPSLSALSEEGQQEVFSLLTSIQDPFLKQDLIHAGCIHQCELVKSSLTLSIQLPYPGLIDQPDYIEDLKHKLQCIKGIDRVEAIFGFKPPAPLNEQVIPSLKLVKHVIMVASGKGGVGKSTTAINIALALKKEGAKVGVLDADIYGPSLPTLCELTEHTIEVTSHDHMKPACQYGLHLQSIGFLVKPEQAQIWRGPMASQTLLQLIQETQWPELDYLIIDMPPGTGDIQLTLSQKLNLSGALIVTTPQDLATADAKKGIVMFQRVQVPILGIIENMSYHVCKNCGHHDDIFGTFGADEIASAYQVPLVGKIPLHRSIREQADLGCPTVEIDEHNALSVTYRDIAKQAVSHLKQHSAPKSVSIEFTEK